MSSFLEGLFWGQELLRIALGRAGLNTARLLPVPTLQKANTRAFPPDRDSTQRLPCLNGGAPLGRLLVIGQLQYGSTSASRLKALKTLASATESVDISPLITRQSTRRHVLTHHLYTGSVVAAVNRALVEKGREFNPDVVWIDRGMYIWPESLLSLRTLGVRYFIHFTPDNHRLIGNQSRHYWRSVPLYNAHVTTKLDNIEWLERMGARRVAWMGKGFDPELHRPLALSLQEQDRFSCEIGFVGHWEPSRERLLLQLHARGYQIRVWGGGWHRSRPHPLFANCRHLVGEDYVRALSGAKINLCLLSRWMRDLTTARSVEIPACGKFLLGERNPEHQALFEEGLEAEFYESFDELTEKIDYYLAHAEARECIARAGRVRCLKGYRNETLLRKLIEQLQLRNH